MAYQLFRAATINILNVIYFFRAVALDGFSSDFTLVALYSLSVPLCGRDKIEMWMPTQATSSNDTHEMELLRWNDNINDDDESHSPLIIIITKILLIFIYIPFLVFSFTADEISVNKHNEWKIINKEQNKERMRRGIDMWTNGISTIDSLLNHLFIHLWMKYKNIKCHQVDRPRAVWQVMWKWF